MTRPLPDWQPLPHGGETPALEAARMAAAAGSGLVAFAASATGHQDGWAPELAAEIGRRWATEGLTVRLLDLSLDDPRLHGPLNVAPEEGVTDAIRFGASLGHVLRPAGGVLFASAGTAVADPEATLRAPGLDHLVRRLLEREGVSLLYVSMGSPGAAVVLDRADQVVVLAEASHDAAGDLGEASIKTVAVVGPPESSRRSEDQAAAPEEAELAASPLPAAPPMAAGVDPLRNREPDPFDLPASAAEAPEMSTAPVAAAAEAESTEKAEDVVQVAPDPGYAVTRSKSLVGPVTWVIVLLFLVLMAVALQMGWIGVPSAFLGQAPAAPPGSVAAFLS